MAFGTVFLCFSGDDSIHVVCTFGHQHIVCTENVCRRFVEQNSSIACLVQDRRRIFCTLHSKGNGKYDAIYLQPSDHAITDLLCFNVKLLDVAGSDEKRKKICDSSRVNL